MPDGCGPRYRSEDASKYDYKLITKHDPITTTKGKEWQEQHEMRTPRPRPRSMPPNNNENDNSFI